MLKQYQLKNYSFRLVFLLIALSVIGIIAVGSAQESLQNKQLAGVVFGLVVMIIISLIDFNMILSFYWVMYGLNIVLLALVLIMGSSSGGATRWLYIGFKFQPSELSKIILILFFARMFSQYQESINNFKTIVIFGILIFVPWIFIKIQPNLSTSIIVAIIFCIMYYIAGLSYKIIRGFLISLIPIAGIFFVLLLQPKQAILKRVFEPYQINRILAFLHMSSGSTTSATSVSNLVQQQENSVMVIGSGMLFGKGFHENTISSVKNTNFIPEVHTDFIFAVIGEQFGFIGSALVVGLLLLIVLECFWIGRKAKELSGSLICYGIGTWIGFQGFINICVVTNTMPNTGVTLPFVSYGLTSIVSLFIAMGFVLNVGLQPKKY